MPVARASREREMGDRGATAILVAISLLLLIGMAAIAIDIGFGFSERRSDVSAADVGVMAGALDAVNGQIAVVNQALTFVRQNLPSTYTDGEWQTLWEGCVDPPAARNFGPYSFVALSPPAGWSVAQPADWCMSLDPAHGLFRVRVPDQAVATTFGRVLGSTELNTNAAAISRIGSRGPGGIVPFGLGASASGGQHLCLSSGPTGLPADPCTGSITGNFGTIKARQFGNTFLGTTENCQASPVGLTLAQNIATGIDHLVVTDPDGNPANEVRDVCFNAFVDTLNTDSGFPNNGAEEGLVGPLGGFTPRLKKIGPFTNIVNGHSINNAPLWAYLLSSGPDYGGTDPSTTSDDAPAACAPSSFTGNAPSDWDGNGVPDDIDGDGNPDQASSWQHMLICLRQYVGDWDFDGDLVGDGEVGDPDRAPHGAVIFSEALQDNGARFVYVPHFWEATLGTGNEWLHIRRFQAVYLQSTAWRKGNDWVFHLPGETCNPPCVGNGFAMKALSAFTFPDAALPAALRGGPLPSGGGLNPFSPELFR